MASRTASVPSVVFQFLLFLLDVLAVCRIWMALDLRAFLSQEEEKNETNVYGKVG